MNGLTNSDIFFFITSVTVGFFLLAIIIIAIYIIKILNDIRKISRLIHDEGGRIIGDIDHFRSKLRSKEFDFSVSSIFALAKNYLKSKFLKEENVRAENMREEKPRPATRKPRTKRSKIAEVEDEDSDTDL